jgi:hypothetical protein
LFTINNVPFSLSIELIQSSLVEQIRWGTGTQIL